MSDETKPLYAYLDTNALVEHRPPRDIDWCSHLKARRVVLVVSAIVVHELQSLKDRGTLSSKKRGRVADRIALIEGELQSHLGAPALVNINPGVDWIYEPRTPSTSIFEQHELDRKMGDDVIAAFVLARAQTDRACLVAHDAGARLRVRALGLEAYDMPPGSALAAEPDDDQKELRELRRQVALFPRVQLKLPSNDATFAYELPAPIDATDDEIDDQIARLGEHVALFDPDDVKAMLSQSMLMSPPPKSEIDRYHRKRDRYLVSARSVLTGLIQHHNAFDLWIPLAGLVVLNTGSSPAESVEVVLNFRTALGLSADPPLIHVLPQGPPQPEFRGSATEEALRLMRRVQQEREPVVDQFREAPPKWVLDGPSLSFRMRKLAHKRPKALPTAYVQLASYETAGPFEVDYEIHGDNIDPPVLRSVAIKVTKTDRSRRLQLLKSRSDARGSVVAEKFEGGRHPDDYTVDIED